MLFYSDHVRPTPNLSFWFILSHVLFTSLGPTTQHVQHIKQVDLSSHSASHYYRFSPFSTQNTMFNIWTNLASWVMFEMSFPSPTTRQYVEQMKKVCILSHDWNLQLVDPTMQYVQHMKKVDMWSPFLKFIPPGPNQAIYTFWPLRQHNIQHHKPIRWIYEQSRNVTSSLYFELLSFPCEKQYLEHTKEWAFDIYNSVALRCNTLNMWS